MMDQTKPDLWHLAQLLITVVLKFLFAITENKNYYFMAFDIKTAIL